MYIQSHMFLCTYISRHTRVYVNISAYTCIQRRHVQTGASMNCIHIYIYVHMYTYMYLNMHVYVKDAYIHV